MRIQVGDSLRENAAAVLLAGDGSIRPVTASGRVGDVIGRVEDCILASDANEDGFFHRRPLVLHGCRDGQIGPALRMRRGQRFGLHRDAGTIFLSPEKEGVMCAYLPLRREDGWRDRGGAVRGDLLLAPSSLRIASLRFPPAPEPAVAGEAGLGPRSRASLLAA